MLPSISGTFRVATEPELRFTPSGMAICDVRAVATRRAQRDNEWVDANTFWSKLTGFKKQAENMAESFKVGDLVVVVGQVETQEWEDSNGVKRISVNVLVSAIGHSTEFDAGSTAKQARGTQQQGGGEQSRQQQQPRQDDPWANTGQQSSDEPPF